MAGLSDYGHFRFIAFLDSRGDRGGKIVKGMEGIIAWERMAVESF